MTCTKWARETVLISLTLLVVFSKCKLSDCIRGLRRSSQRLQSTVNASNNIHVTLTSSFLGTFKSILLHLSGHVTQTISRNSGFLPNSTHNRVNISHLLSTIFPLIEATGAVLEASVTLLLASSMPKACESSLRQGELKAFRIWRTWVSSPLVWRLIN